MTEDDDQATEPTSDLREAVIEHLMMKTGLPRIDVELFLKDKNLNELPEAMLFNQSNIAT